MKRKLQKQRGIFLALLSLLCSISIQAQTWTAPALTGSVPTTATAYYLYNVGSNGYLTRGGWWTSEAVVSAQPRLNASTSVIKWTATNTSGSIWTFQYNLAGSNVSGNFLFPANTSNGDVFTDGSGDDTWNVVQMDGINNIYSIQVVSPYGGYNATQYLGTAASTESTNMGIANPVRYNMASGNSYTQWKFVVQADLDLYNARILLDKYMTYGKNKGLDVSSYITTYNAGVTADINTAAANLLTALGRTDVTSSITNPSFEDVTYPTGWTNAGSFVKQTNAPGQGWTKDGTNYTEKYTSAGWASPGYLGVGSMTQTVSGLSSGLYELVVSGHAVQQAGANPLHTGAFITAGSQTTEMVAGQDYSISNIVVAGSTLTIGYSLVAPVACNWTGFDNFKLYYYGPVAVPSIAPSISQLSFNGGDTYVKDSLTITGLNLSDAISISAPSGITVNPTSLPSGASNAKVVVTYNNSTNVSGNITFTSGTTTANVAVTAVAGADCFTPLYSTGNAIADPRFNAASLDAGGFGGWGNLGRRITHTNTYCGSGSAYILGSCWPDGGSLDRALTTANGNALKPLTLYRLRAMINSQATGGKTFQFEIAGANGSASQFFQIGNTGGWKQIDTTFTTGATVTEHGIYFNSCTNAPVVADTCFIDNYELYAIPTWNGTGNWATAANWTGAVVPSTGADIYVMSGTLTIDQNISLANVTVAPGAKVTLNSGNTLTVTGNLTIKSDATGTGTFVDSNPTGGLTVSGTTHVQQYLTSGRNWYVSSPVSAATTAALSTATSVVSYDEVHGTSAPWVTESSTLNPMKGYISTATTSNAAITFSGSLNTGSQSIALTRTVGQTKEGFNLVGNPYPSHLNWTGAIATAANTLSTIWYRTFVSSAYAFHTYNATGGVGSPAEVTGVIPPMQAFWVRANVGGGTLSLDNTMRLHSASSNPLKAPSASKVVSQLVRLQVSNGTNNDEAVIYFNANASDAFDAFDSPKMTNEDVSVPEIYTMAGTEQVVINGLNQVTSNKELLLGFATGESNSFTIKATEMSNFNIGTTVVLRDNLLNIEQNLTDGTAYNFTSDVASTANRFTVIFKSAGSITGQNNTGNSQMYVYKNASNQIVVNCKGDINSNAMVSVYNALGQKLYTEQITGNNTVIGEKFPSGVYMVTVNNGGKSTTKKVILN